MKIRMDKILQEIVEQAYEESHLRRSSCFLYRDVVFAEVLADLESNGDRVPTYRHIRPRLAATSIQNDEYRARITYSVEARRHGYREYGQQALAEGAAS
jgi:hypothetical protein